MKQYPIEVWDHMTGSLYVATAAVRDAIRRGKRDGSGTKACRVTYGPSVAGQYGDTEDVIVNGEKVGERFFSYE